MWLAEADNCIVLIHRAVILSDIAFPCISTCGTKSPPIRVVPCMMRAGSAQKTFPLPTAQTVAGIDGANTLFHASYQGVQGRLGALGSTVSV